MLKFAAPSLPRFIEECQEHGVKTVSFSDREVEFIFTAPSVYSGTEGSTPILLELKYVFVGMVPSISWRERTKTKLFERLQQREVRQAAEGALIPERQVVRAITRRPQQLTAAEEAAAAQGARQRRDVRGSEGWSAA